MNDDPEDFFPKYKEELVKIASETDIPEAVKRSVTAYRVNILKVFKSFPDSLQLAEEVRRIKEYSINHIKELVEEACESFERNKASCYLAKTAKEANEIVGDLVGSGKLVVKAKSMVTEEIGLREYLQELGNEVWETDLGELIIQLAGERPTHLIYPSIHMTRERVAKLFKEKLGVEVEPDISKLVATARRFLRDKLVKADVGISGANAVAADSGSILTIENESNIRLSTALPPKYIAVTGVEKIVPKLRDALTVLEATWRFIGYPAPSYVNMIFSASKTGDIENTVTYGAQGPKEMHVVLVDNGRMEVAKHPVLKESLYCLKCGACMFECPIFTLVAGNYGDKYPGGIGLIWSYFTGGNKERITSMLYACALCYRCKERCPLKIDTPRMITTLRSMLVKEGYVPPQVREIAEETLEANEKILEELEKNIQKNERK